MERSKLVAQADKVVEDILKAAMSWAREVPPALHLPIRAVCVRLAEMVADQRHYLAPLPEPQETERRTVLELVADKLRSAEVVAGIEPNLAALAERELRATGSWALVANSQTEWVDSAIGYLESCGDSLPEAGRPDPYWADDVVGGIVVSVRAIIGTDDLHVRIESQYGGGRPAGPPKEEEPQ
ncbi:MAG TPA: hypothetical protein VLL51_11335 [Gemmatimonadales bacterium]|nr:hypothetical protein [Gemmatimonadales bacterium]